VFLRGMKDPFPYARLAAVRATSACKSFYDTGLIVGKVFEFMWVKERQRSFPVIPLVHSKLIVVCLFIQLSILYLKTMCVTNS
jgi:hypothetical protein